MAWPLMIDELSFGMVQHSTAATLTCAPQCRDDQPVSVQWDPLTTAASAKAAGSPIATIRPRTSFVQAMRDRATRTPPAVSWRGGVSRHTTAVIRLARCQLQSVRGLLSSEPTTPTVRNHRRSTAPGFDADPGRRMAAQELARHWFTAGRRGT
jgi:hypothetical protein